MHQGGPAEEEKRPTSTVHRDLGPNVTRDQNSTRFDVEGTGRRRGCWEQVVMGNGEERGVEAAEVPMVESTTPITTAMRAQSTT